MNTTEYARLFKSLLPPGDVWPHETNDESAFDGLIRALSVEPARIDEAALLLLDTIIPDNENTDLAAWERLIGAPITNMTDAERLARIRGVLQAIAAVDQPSLQQAIRDMSGYPDAILYHRGRPACVAGDGNAGDSCGEQGHAWLCELYPNTLVATADDFEAWTGFVSITNANAQSPVTLDQTAATGNIGGGGGNAVYIEFAADDDQEGYASLWIKVDVATILSMQFQDRAGAMTTSKDIELTPDLWHRVEYRAGVNTGADSPLLVLTTDTAVDCSLSWAVAGIRNSTLEDNFVALTQIHTRGIFGIQGEYATLIGLTQVEASW